MIHDPLCRFPLVFVSSAYHTNVSHWTPGCFLYTLSTKVHAGSIIASTATADTGLGGGQTMQYLDAPQDGAELQVVFNEVYQCRWETMT